MDGSGLRRTDEDTVEGGGYLVFPVSVSMKDLWLIARTTQAAAFHRKKSRPVTRKTI
jgi:hypothetical protein